MTILDFRFILGRPWEGLCGHTFSVLSFVFGVSLVWKHPIYLVGVGAGMLLGLAGWDLICQVLEICDREVKSPWEEE